MLADGNDNNSVGIVAGKTASLLALVTISSMVAQAPTRVTVDRRL